MKSDLAAEQRIQESQYEVPYHYVPTVDGSGFSQTLYWSWGMRYLCGLEMVLRALEQEPFESLLDVGCGDGRFLREAKFRFPDAALLGVDYSEAAVRLARALNPEIAFQCADVIKDSSSPTHDVVTMVEVLEHIPPDAVSCFLAGVARRIKPGGRIVLTVPHANKRLNPKHYQHFTMQMLESVLSESFEVRSVQGFDAMGLGTRLMMKLLGGGGKRFVVTHPGLNGYVFRRVLKEGCRGISEGDCGRLIAIAVARSGNTRD